MDNANKPTRRRSRAELRQLVLDAAADLVSARGLGVVPMNVTYQQVFQHLEATRGIRITRASVHERIWQSQEEFQLDVIVHSHLAHADLESSTLAPALAVFDETVGWHPFDRVREMTRVAAPLSLVEAEAEPLYFAWVGMTMSMSRDSSLDHTTRELLGKATSRYYTEVDERTASLLRQLGAALGVRPRRDLVGSVDDGWKLLARLGASLSEGATVRTRFESSELPNVMMNTGPDGEPQEWTAFAAGYWALLQTFLEIDPEAHPDLVD